MDHSDDSSDAKNMFTKMLTNYKSPWDCGSNGLQPIMKNCDESERVACYVNRTVIDMLGYWSTIFEKYFDQK